MSEHLTTLERHALDLFEKRRTDLRASEVAEHLRVGLSDALAAIASLGELGYLVVAKIRRGDGSEDAQARLSAMPPKAAPRAPESAPVEEPFRSRRQIVRAGVVEGARTERMPPRIAQQATTIRIGLFSDGSMQIARGVDAFDLTPEETRSLFTFLDRFGGLATEGLQ